MVKYMSVVVKVMLYLTSVIITPLTCARPIGAHGGKGIYFWSFCFRGVLGFLNRDDICMYVVNKQFELLEFVSDSVYIDL